MITTAELVRAFAPRLLRSLCCPVCLRDLRLDPARPDQLVCEGCAALYGSVDGLPILLIEDENWRRKEDEISGEVAFNTETVPASVHVERNAFVDGNTAELLQDADLDLSRAEVLVVGCSMAELEFFIARSRSVCCLDIVPSLSLQALQATRRRKLDASWVCGDGEALPCSDETFDVVVVRQALHHMLNYGAAVREFLRVCRTGGAVLLVDEPFAAADGEAPPLSTHADRRRVFADVEFAHVRHALGLPARAEDAAGIGESGSGFQARAGYIDAVPGDNESLLADKYATLSLVGLLHALDELGAEVQMFAPRQVGWVEGSGSTLQFKHGPNPLRDRPLLERIVAAGNASVVARKVAPLRTPRDRTSLRPASLEKCLVLAQA